MTPPNAATAAFPRLDWAEPGGLGTCAICRQSMTLIEDEQTTHPNCDPPGGDTEEAVRAVQTVWPDAEIIGQWLTKDELFPGSGQCKDCGDPLNGPGLTQRCRGRHNERTAP